MQFPNFLDAASNLSAFEVSYISSSVVDDVREVVAAAEPASPELSLLAARAIESLEIALQEAAGSPADGRWLVAYEMLAAFVDRYAQYSHGTGAPNSFGRLSGFLAENADLSQNGTERTQPFSPTLAHAHG